VSAGEHPAEVTLVGGTGGELVKFALLQRQVRLTPELIIRRSSRRIPRLLNPPSQRARKRGPVPHLKFKEKK